MQGEARETLFPKGDGTPTAEEETKISPPPPHYRGNSLDMIILPETAPPSRNVMSSSSIRRLFWFDRSSCHNPLVKFRVLNLYCIAQQHEARSRSNYCQSACCGSRCESAAIANVTFFINRTVFIISKIPEEETHRHYDNACLRSIALGCHQISRGFSFFPCRFDGV